MKWFKFYGQDFLTDPKIKTLSIFESQCWIILMCLANAEDKEGVIGFVSEHELMLSAKIESDSPFWYETVGVLGKLEMLEMISTELKMENQKDPAKNIYTVTLLNFKKRQEVSLTNAQRQARFRAKHNESNGKVTDQHNESNARIDKNRIDIYNIGKSAEAPKLKSYEKLTPLSITEEYQAAEKELQKKLHPATEVKKK